MMKAKSLRLDSVDGILNNPQSISIQPSNSPVSATIPFLPPRLARAASVFIIDEVANDPIPTPPTPVSAELDPSIKKRGLNVKFPMQSIPPFKSKVSDKVEEVGIERRTSEPDNPFPLTYSMETEERRLSDPIIKKPVRQILSTTTSGERVKDLNRMRKHNRNSLSTSKILPIKDDTPVAESFEPISKRLRVIAPASTPPISSVTSFNTLTTLFDAARKILHDSTTEPSQADPATERNVSPPPRARVGSIDHTGMILPSLDTLNHHREQIIQQAPSRFQGPSTLRSTPIPSPAMFNAPPQTSNLNSYLRRPMNPSQEMPAFRPTPFGTNGTPNNYQSYYPPTPNSGKNGNNGNGNQGIQNPGSEVRNRTLDSRALENRNAPLYRNAPPPLQINTSEIERSAIANRFSRSPNSATVPLENELPFSSHSSSQQPLRPQIMRPLNATQDPKARFLSLFATFYDSLGDATILQRTLEDNIGRSNVLLNHLDSPRIQERFAQMEQRIEELERLVGVSINHRQYR